LRIAAAIVALHVVSWPCQTEAKIIAKRPMNGLVIDLDVARKSGDLLVATRSDPEIPGGGKNGISLISSAAKLIWKKNLNWQVRAQSISPDGTLAVISTYDGKLTAIGRQGRTVWETEETCRPYVLKNLSVFCYHDEDSAPDIAFDWFDKSGKKKLSFPIIGDILAFAISTDERNLALALTDGRVILLENGGTSLKSSVRALVQKTLPGEILDIAVGSGTSPIVTVISRDKKPGAVNQTQLATLDHSGKLSSPVALGFAAEQLELSGTANHLLIRGGHRSKSDHVAVLAAFEISVDGTPLARATLKKRAESRIPGVGPAWMEFPGGDKVALGAPCPDCFLLWDPFRNKSFEIPVRPEATLFRTSRVRAKARLIIALDNGHLVIYELSTPGERP